MRFFGIRFPIIMTVVVAMLLWDNHCIKKAVKRADQKAQECLDGVFGASSGQGCLNWRVQEIKRAHDVYMSRIRDIENRLDQQLLVDYANEFSEKLVKSANDNLRNAKCDPDTLHARATGSHRFTIESHTVDPYLLCDKIVEQVKGEFGTIIEFDQMVISMDTTSGNNILIIEYTVSVPSLCGIIKGRIG